MTKLGPNSLTQVFTEIKNWVVSKLSSKANDSDVVHTSGDETIAGSKTFSKARTKFFKSLDLYHDEDYKLNTNPSVKAYQYVFFTGKSGWYSAFLENQVDTDGASYCNLSTRNTNEQSAAVQLAIDSNGVKTFKPATNNDISLGASTDKWKDVYANTFNGKLVGNADTATKATKDASGNVITDTYATKKELGSKADDANVVHKSGNETIAGSKTYVDGYQIFTGYRFYVKNSKQELGAIPKGTNIWNGMGFYDKNNKATFSIENGHITDGVTKLSFKVTKNADGVVNEPGIFLEASYSTTTDAGKPVVRVHDLNPFNDNAYTLGTSTLKWKAVYANTFNGNLVGNAATATKATNNASGNELSNNIIKGLSVSGKVITYTKLDGSTGTITTQDTNTWTAFKGATSSANGTAGYVPAPTKGNQDKFFKADGTWATPTNTTYSVATTSKNGLMSSTDKTKLDGLSNYTLPTASSTLGGVKTTSTVTSTSGLTACPIISGVVYYKDTNTDVKVTNTLNNTTKAYITGTTSATTNTGTQIFDSGVYLTTTAGQLHADIDFPITEAQVNKILGIS